MSAIYGVYHYAEPHILGVRHAFIQCSNCGSLLRADMVTLTVEGYGLPSQHVRFQCPCCRYFAVQPDVLLIHEQTIDSLCRYSPKVSSLMADQRRAGERRRVERYQVVLEEIARGEHDLIGSAEVACRRALEEPQSDD